LALQLDTGACTPDLLLNHVFAIVLDDSAKQPWTQTLASLSRSGLQPMLVPGVKGMDLNVTSLIEEANAAGRPYTEMTQNEYGIAMAHKSVYNMIDFNSIPCAMVFEADSIVHPSFVSRIRSLNFPPDFDLVRVGWFSFSLLGQFDTEPQGPSPFPISGPQKLVRSDKGSGSTGCYVLSLKGARKMLKIQTPVWLTSDGAFQVDHYKEVLPIDQYLVQYYSTPRISWQNVTEGSDNNRTSIFGSIIGEP